MNMGESIPQTLLFPLLKLGAIKNKPISYIKITQ